MTVTKNNKQPLALSDCHALAFLTHADPTQPMKTDATSHHTDRQKDSNELKAPQSFAALSTCQMKTATTP